MAVRIANFRGGTAPHTVTIIHGYWKGNATIVIDDSVIYERPFMICDYGLDAPFDLDGKTGLVTIRPRPWFTFRYRLVVGDCEVQLERQQKIRGGEQGVDREPDHVPS